MKSKYQSEHKHWMTFLGVVAVITVVGYYFVYPQKLYKPGEELFDFGYNLGLAGGVMMLILLLYPLRKRWKLMANVGFLPTWFKWHMLLGILGPLLIIFHSTYHFYIPFIHPQGSMNAAVAMYCMLLVSGSGTFGRFFYTKIHQGLYGKLTSLKELSQELEQTGDVKSLLNFAPDVEKKMDEFRIRGESLSKIAGYGFANFIKIGFEAASLSRSLPREVHQIMLAQAREQNFTAQQMAGLDKMFREYREKITEYIRAARDTAQFHTYERLFSWWHVFHIPLVYMMVFSAFYHVYAVHAY